MTTGRHVSRLLAGTAILATMAATTDAVAANLPSLGLSPAGERGEMRALLEGAIVEPIGIGQSGDSSAPPAPVVVSKPTAEPAMSSKESSKEVVAAPRATPSPQPSGKSAQAARKGGGRPKLVLDAQGIAVFERESADPMVRAGSTAPVFDDEGSVVAGAEIHVFDPKAGLVRIAIADKPTASRQIARIGGSASPLPAPVQDPGSDRQHASLVGAEPEGDRQDDALPAARVTPVERKPLEPVATARVTDDGPRHQAENGRPLVLAEHRQPARGRAEPRPAREKVAKGTAIDASMRPVEAPRTAQQPAIAPADPGLFLAFDPASAAIDPSEIRDVVDRLAADASLKVRLTGFATIGGAVSAGAEPAPGSPAARLGVNRSLAVRARLVEQGIHASRFVVTRPGQGADGVLAVLTRAA